MRMRTFHRFRNNDHGRTYLMEEKIVPLSDKCAIEFFVLLSGPSCAKQVRKGSVTYGLGADISLPQCLSERPGI